MHTTNSNKLIIPVVGLIRAPGILRFGIDLAVGSVASTAVPRPHKLK